MGSIVSPDSCTRSSKRAVVAIFARLPVPGKVKTRLAAGVGAEAAAVFYKSCAEIACKEVLRAHSHPAIDTKFALTRDSRCTSVDGVVFSAAADDVSRVASWLQCAAASLPVLPQVQHEDIGVRMIAALTEAAAAASSDITSQSDATAADSNDKLLRYEAAIVVGTDIPDLSSEILSAAAGVLLGYPEAIAAAEQAGSDGHHTGGADVVLGPAADGGFYLLGFRTEALLQAAVQNCSVFEGVQWSCSSVLQRTVAGLQQQGLRVASLDTLPTLRDIDTVQDVALWLSEQQSKPGAADMQQGQHHQLVVQMRDALERSKVTGAVSLP